MNWLPYIAIFLTAVTASFSTSNEFSKKTNRVIGLVGADLLFLAIFWNFFANGWISGIISIFIGFTLYSVSKRSH